jgi:putative aldouronate transport system permease protein
MAYIEKSAGIITRNTGGERVYSAFSEKLSAKWKAVKRDRALYVMLIPPALFFLIFMYKPMYGLKIAFQSFDINNVGANNWVGFDNFVSFFSGPYFARILANTFSVSLYSLIFGFPVPVILALMLNEIKNKRVKSIGQTVTYLPYFISTVVVAGIVTNFLAPENGLLNILIRNITGNRDFSVYFLTQKEFIRTIYVTTGIWQSSGFGAIIYISALAGIETEQYEAAVLDGASRLKQLIYITLPGLMPMPKRVYRDSRHKIIINLTPG